MPRINHSKYRIQIPLTRLRREFKSISRQFENNQRLIAEITHNGKIIYYFINSGLLISTKTSLLCLRNGSETKNTETITAWLDYTTISDRLTLSAYENDMLEPGGYVLPLFNNDWTPIPETILNRCNLKTGDTLDFEPETGPSVNVRKLHNSVSDRELKQHEFWSRVEHFDLTESQWHIFGLCLEYLELVRNR